MSEFKFECPHCSQHMRCDERMSGRQIQCPTCQYLIVIPASPAHQARGDYQPESGRTWQTFITPLGPKGPPQKQPEPPPAGKPPA
jgi:hypothetical protein